MTLDFCSILAVFKAHLQRYRHRLAFYLDDVHTPIGLCLNLAIAGLILLSAAIFVAETYDLPASVQVWLKTIDTACLVIFVGEYGLRWWCAPSRRSFLLNPYALLDLLAIGPFLLGFVDVRFIRLLRWLRVLRLFRFLNRHSWLGRNYSENQVIFARILFTLFAIIFVYSGLIYQVEHPTNADEFRNFVDAFYFSVVTMTTVGFGDVTPDSTLGRLLTVLMILSGVALIPWQLGELIQQLVKTPPQVPQICPKCQQDLHAADAIFCRRCGTQLPVMTTEGG